MECPPEVMTLAFLEGDLSESDYARVEDHAESCEKCRAFIIQNAMQPTHNPGGSTSGWSDEIADRVVAKLEQATAAEGWPEALRLPAVLGDYRLLEIVGRGGVGTVYRAEQSSLGRTVAVKVIRRQLLKPSHVHRFVAEATLAARLDHPGIVPVYDVGRRGPFVFVLHGLSALGDVSRRP